MSDFDSYFDFTGYTEDGIPSEDSPESAAQASPSTWACDDAVQPLSEPRQAWTEAFKVPGNSEKMNLPYISDDPRFYQQEEPLYGASLDPTTFAVSQRVPGSSLDYHSGQQSGHAAPCALLNDTGIPTSSWSVNGFGGSASPFAAGGSSSMMPAQSPQSSAHFMPQGSSFPTSGDMSSNHMSMNSLTGATQDCADFTSAVSARPSRSAELVPDTNKLFAASTLEPFPRSKIIEMCQTDRSIFRYGQRCEKCEEACYSNPEILSCVDQFHQLCHSTILGLVEEELKRTHWSEANWTDKHGKMEEFHIWLYIFEMADVPEEIIANRKAHRHRKKQRRARKARKVSTVKGIEVNIEDRDNAISTASARGSSSLDVSLASSTTSTSQLNKFETLVQWLREQDAVGRQTCYSSKKTHICASCLTKTWDPPGKCLDSDHQLHHHAAALVVKGDLVAVGDWQKAPKIISAYQIVHWFHGISCPESDHHDLQMAHNAKRRSLRLR